MARPLTCKGQEWRVDETAEKLVSRIGEIEPLIIVGIYNTGDHRIDEYTPTTRSSSAQRGGKAPTSTPPCCSAMN